jgi:hypothetical protein
MAHLILLGLISLIALGEEYKLRSSLLSSVLQPPVTSCLFDPHTLLGTLLSNYVQVYTLAHETAYSSMGRNSTDLEVTQFFNPLRYNG